jgi:hypothetical protein
MQHSSLEEKQSCTPEYHRDMNLDSLGSLRHTTSKQTTRYDETSRYDTRPDWLSLPLTKYLLGLSLVLL